MKNVLIKTDRYFLRSLTKEDATAKYLSWLEEKEISKYIETAKSTTSIEELEEFILSRSDREDVLFLGIFDEKKTHLGNIKYEPVDIKNNLAVMGIMIGDVHSRGKGIAQEVISGSANWLKDKLGVTKIYLGVSKVNLPAIQAYERIGFLEDKDDYFKPCDEAIYMKLSLE